MGTGRLIRQICAVLACAVFVLPASDAAEPLFRAHAHNDYLHPRPLLDALQHGFRSVEADIWLTNGQLLVAHDLDKVRPERTLQTLYLEPLRNFVRTRAAGEAQPITLLIDFKSEAESTYEALRPVLQEYADVLTRFESNRVHTNAVIVILSGNRPIAGVSRERVRHAALDGRLADLDGNPSPALFPLISDNWTRHFAWKGEGPLPGSEREKLAQIVSRAHAQGRRIRLWAVPDHERAWRVLFDAGVDLLNTDRLLSLEQFLRNQ